MTNNFYTGVSSYEYLVNRADAVSLRNQKNRAELFKDFVNNSDIVLDFGCGTGMLLACLDVKQRFGVEISDAAKKEAELNGLIVYSNLRMLPDNHVDRVISFHALEHVDNPLDIAIEIKRVLKQRGKLRIIVPCEVPVFKRFRTFETNEYKHLYTWTPLNLGNLLERAGFENIESKFEVMPSKSWKLNVVRRIPFFGKLIHYYWGLKYNAFNTVVTCVA